MFHLNVITYWWLSQYLFAKEDPCRYGPDWPLQMTRQQDICNRHADSIIPRVKWHAYIAFMAFDRLTHCGCVAHICVSNLAIIGSDNGLSPGRRQAIIRTNVGILLIGPLGTNFSEILIKVYTFALKEMHFKNSVCKMAPISYRSECVKARWLRLGWRRVSFKTVGSSYHCHKALRAAAHSCIYVKSSLPDSSFTEFCSQWFNWQLGCIGSSTGLAPTNAYPVHWRIHTCGIRGRWAIGDYRQGPVIPA